jgi:hypothetical protein
MNAEQKALKACSDYARLSAEIKSLTFEIGAHLGACLDFKEAKGVHPVETCLVEAYAHDEDDSGRYFLTAAEQDEILSKCVYCSAAHEAIQGRKAARKSLGAAKRAITMIGRKAIKEVA